MLFFDRQRPDQVIAETPGESPDVAHEAGLRTGYDRGRREERLAEGSPFLHAVIGAAAMIGLTVSILAYHERSFARAGAIMDTELTRARIAAAPVAREAALETGRVAQVAGQLLQSQGREVERTGVKLEARNAEPSRS
jgi:hypothetical protein